MKRLSYLLLLLIIIGYACENTELRDISEANGSIIQNDIVISGRTRILDEQTMNQINSVDGDNIVIEAGADGFDHIKVGDILIANISEKTPCGLLKKVIAIKETDGHLELSTIPAIITDIVEDGIITQSGKIVPQETTKALYIRKGLEFVPYDPAAEEKSPEEMDFYVKLDYLPLNGDIGIKGYVGVSFDYSFDIRIESGTLKYLEFYIEPAASYGLELVLEKAINMGDVSIEKALLQYPLEGTPLLQRPSIKMLIAGIIPIFIFPEIEYVVGFSGDALSSVSTGVFNTTAYRIGLRYDNGNWIPIKEKTVEKGYYPPELNANADLELFWGPEVVFGIGVPGIGPEVYLNDYFNFRADITKTPWWNLDLGIKAGCAIDVDCRFFSVNYDMFEFFNEIIYSWEAQKAYFTPDLFLISPGNHLADVTTSNTFIWQSDAALFDLYCDNSYPPTTKINTADITTTSYTINNLEYNSTYYWQVVAKDGNGNTSASDIFDFVTIEETTGPSDTGSLTDYDGNEYKTVKIGEQWWMAENLKVTHYENGTEIPNVINGTEWAALGDNNIDDAFCYYGNNPESVYGVLYTYAAAKDACPAGWHLPDDQEWKTLEIYIGLSPEDADATGWRGDDEGRIIKSVTGWNSTSHGTDDYEFSALPGGYRAHNYNGLFWNGDNYAYYWTDTEYDALLNYNRYLCGNIDPKIGRNYSEKSNGYSVRCVKD